MSRRVKKVNPQQPPVEDRGIEAATVAWMLTMTTTLGCELAAIAGRWYWQFHQHNDTVAVLSGLLLFAALVSGIFSLVLAAVVLKARSPAPPRGLTVFALVVGAAPLAVLLIRYLRDL